MGKPQETLMGKPQETLMGKPQETLMGKPQSLMWLPPLGGRRRNYRTIFKRVPTVRELLRSWFQLLSLATVVSNSSAILNSVSPRLTL